MADVCYIRCPECDEKFKSTADKEGKKIRCPECDEPFKVTAKMISLPKGAGRQKGAKVAGGGANKEAIQDKKKPSAPARRRRPSRRRRPRPPLEQTTMMTTAPTPSAWSKSRWLRRPSCAKELLNEKDIICVHCGYNTLTREVGETKRTFEITAADHWLHLAPALGGLGFAFFALMCILFYNLVFPRYCTGWMEFFNSEPMRLFLTVIALFLIYAAGSFGLNQVIFSPKPKEREKE